MPLRKKKYSKAKKVVPKTVKQYVKAKIAKSIEDKYIDTTISDQGGSLGGSITSFAHPDQGTDNGQRIGDKIRPTFIRFRYDVNLKSTATRGCVGRVIVFHWKPATTPLVSDILAYSGLVNITNSPYNENIKSQYRILYDKTMNLNTNTAEIMHYKKNIKRSKMMRIQIAPGNLGSSTGNNKLYIIYCDNEVGGTEGSQWTFVARLYYEDA